MNSRLRAQVVIVGGGPVGMLLAAELGDYGVSTVLLEAQASVSERPKASVVHARALQGLVRRGYFGEMVPRTAEAGEVEAPFRFAGIPGLSICAPASEPGPVLRRPQADLERLFERRARAAGVRVLREHWVTEVAQDHDGVRVAAVGPSGRVECTARYVVGADGGRSTVRDLTGVPTQTYGATTSGLAGLVTLENPDDLPSGWHSTPRGWIVVRHMPGAGTHIKTLDCSGAHPDRRLEPTAAELRDELARIAGREIAFREPRWLSRFSDFAQLACSYRFGKVFLAGDAAHMHFPVGAQGLSTGLQDALNLGWKLAYVVRGLAPDGLLDTYDAERRPAAGRVIENTRAQLALMRWGPDTDALQALFAGVVAADRMSRHLSNLISGQDVVLPRRTRQSSPWEGRFLQNVSLRTAKGRRDVIGLLRAGRPLLLLFGEADGSHLAQAQHWSQVVGTVRAEPTPQITCEALLLRPDGYVAWASGPGGDRLQDALELYFGACPGRPVQQPAMAGAGALS
ncbi:FAD-dependent monooxygenase [Streptomyces sp. XM83C]|uniref:FAD-dependent monooxygenase n=2 Tax=Streptomyces thermocoprophilus TaxID=78356 RepID=A0ABV5VN64_9ACTN|nr:FAD-dependent monooxygenase [Streptomyces sp. XM83C]MCK1821529.1 FAD-dependent monooxygenase [Streptomyces sp. XM83C]